MPAGRIQLATGEIVQCRQGGQSVPGVSKASLIRRHKLALSGNRQSPGQPSPPEMEGNGIQKGLPSFMEVPSIIYSVAKCRHMQRTD